MDASFRVVLPWTTRWAGGLRRSSIRIRPPSSSARRSPTGCWVQAYASRSPCSGQLPRQDLHRAAPWRSPKYAACLNLHDLRDGPEDQRIIALVDATATTLRATRSTSLGGRDAGRGLSRQACAGVVRTILRDRSPNRRNDACDRRGIDRALPCEPGRGFCHRDIPFRRFTRRL